MKYFLSDIIPRLQQYTRKLDDITCLANQNWILTNSDPSVKTIFIFRKNRELLISKNGAVEEGSWEYVGNNSILIRNCSGSHLFKHGFLDKNILILKQDDVFSEYVLFLNENVFSDKLKTVEQAAEYLERNYLEENKSASDTVSPLGSVVRMFFMLAIFAALFWGVLALILL